MRQQNCSPLFPTLWYLTLLSLKTTCGILARIWGKKELPAWKFLNLVCSTDWLVSSIEAIKFNRWKPEIKGCFGGFKGTAGHIEMLVFICWTQSIKRLSETDNQKTMTVYRTLWQMSSFRLHGTALMCKGSELLMFQKGKGRREECIKEIWEGDGHIITVLSKYVLLGAKERLF